MQNKKIRNFLFLGIILIMSLSSGITESKIVDTIEALSEKTIGEKSAKIKMKEFASLTCGHCAKFHIEVMPITKKKYIDTGLILFTYKDFPLDKFALKASQIARCSGNKNYFNYLDVFYKKQKDWTRTKDPFKALLKIAKFGGLKDEELKVCIGNKSIEDGILKDRLKSSKKFDITATPTIYLDGEKYKGDLTIEALESKIESLLD